MKSLSDNQDMQKVKVIPDKYEILLNKEAKLLSQLRDVRYKLNNIKTYRKKQKMPLNIGLLNRTIEKYQLQVGQKFNNDITGEGTITEIGFRRNDCGIYFVNQIGGKKYFAELGGIKFKTITETRLNNTFANQ